MVHHQHRLFHLIEDLLTGDRAEVGKAVAEQTIGTQGAGDDEAKGAEVHPIGCPIQQEEEITAPGDQCAEQDQHHLPSVVAGGSSPAVKKQNVADGDTDIDIDQMEIIPGAKLQQRNGQVVAADDLHISEHQMVLIIPQDYRQSQRGENQQPRRNTHGRMAMMEISESHQHD